MKCSWLIACLMMVSVSAIADFQTTAPIENLKINGQDWYAGMPLPGKTFTITGKFRDDIKRLANILTVGVGDAVNRSCVFQGGGATPPSIAANIARANTPSDVTGCFYSFSVIDQGATGIYTIRRLAGVDGTFQMTVTVSDAAAAGGATLTVVHGTSDYAMGYNNQVPFGDLTYNAELDYAWTRSGLPAKVDTYLEPVTYKFNAVGSSMTLPKVTASFTATDSVVANAKRAITANFIVDTDDRGSVRSLYVAAVLPGGSIWFKTGPGDSDWQPYHGTFLAYSSGALSSTYTVPVATAVDITRLTGTTVWIGYGTGDADLKYAKVYTVQ